MIDPTRLHDIFNLAVSLSQSDRPAFLQQVCGDDAALRREVERLLTADARFGAVFDTEYSSDANDVADERTAGSPARHPSLSVGTRLGPYDISAALGAGGMGEVYKARDVRLDRTVAIKVLPRGLTGDAEARQRFEREARAIGALSHPHICPLFDVGRQDEIDYIVMAYLDGETLASRLKRGKLVRGQALTYAIELADALAAAHRAGILHRDIKPGNIMLTAAGAVLLDFGLAERGPPSVTQTGSNLERISLTRTGVILGTLHYMAPEQLEVRIADERTDIFAFGVVLYEMVTARRAFEGANDVAVIGNILRADPMPLSVVEPGTPSALDRLVRVCLAKDPNARWQSFTDICTRLAAMRDARIGRIAVLAALLVSGSLFQVPVKGGDSLPFPTSLIRPYINDVLTDKNELLVADVGKKSGPSFGATEIYALEVE